MCDVFKCNIDADTHIVNNAAVQVTEFMMVERSFLTSVPITRPICLSNSIFQSMSSENQSGQEGFSGSVTKTGLILV